jgi:hypothetical protein
MLVLVVPGQFRTAAQVSLLFNFFRHKGKSYAELRTHRRSKFRKPIHSGSTVITVRCIMHSISCHHLRIKEKAVNPNKNIRFTLSPFPERTRYLLLGQHSYCSDCAAGWPEQPKDWGSFLAKARDFSVLFGVHIEFASHPVFCPVGFLCGGR